MEVPRVWVRKEKIPAQALEDEALLDVFLAKIRVGGLRQHQRIFIPRLR
jgi:hypothetical protein